MTEQKLARAEARIDELTGELKRVRKELEQFAYIISHDFQGPVRNIEALAEMVCKRYRGKVGDDAEQCLTFISDSAETLRRLLGAMVSYSRLGRVSLDLAPVDSGTLVDEIVTELQSKEESPSAQIEVGEMPVVTAHPGLLGQVFKHLLDNALKFAAGDAQITVSACRLDGQWQFSVADNGIGIDAQHHEVVFTVFRRLHPPADYPGLGMGLAICKFIVERHGGRIRIDSEVGKGATVRFTLPDQEHK
jgi:light-regulated signal transduction histidine kinase (bacteriophytochrome)